MEMEATWVASIKNVVSVIFIYVSLSTLVLNSRDRHGKKWRPKPFALQYTP